MALCQFQSTRPSRGATWSTFSFCQRRLHFNPRAPRGARLWADRHGVAVAAISIHAPLAGRDPAALKRSTPSSYFNPRAPRGARPRPPTRGGSGGEISIHAPLAGRDAALPGLYCRSGNFNPRAPRGARQQMCTKITYIFALIHKRNTFSCQTPSVRALSKKLSGRFSHKIRCEPPCKTLCAAAPHYTISVPSGRYVCLQPKCSILLSYFFPK